jgi:hypothetical protein
MSHFSMGAINKNTNDYEYPRIANKSNKYKCPCCEKDVIFRNGKIKQPHFAHYKSESPCHYYDRPNETQIHKDAKLLMKSLLDGKKSICILRNCDQINCNCNNNVRYCISNDDYSENTHAVIEHRFNYNNSNRSADVALVENDTIKFIFEICYKNKTKEENRPEPWFEINAEDLINKINSGERINEDGNIIIECIRNYICDKCIEIKLRRENFIKEQERREQQERQRREQQERERLEARLRWENEQYEIQERRRLEIRIRLEKQERERLEARLRWENEQYEIQERWIREEPERRRLEQERQEKIKQLKIECGFDRIISKVREPCSCDMCVCICENPKYELVKLSNNLFCVRCNKWKCRCESAT